MKLFTRPANLSKKFSIMKQDTSVIQPIALSFFLVVIGFVFVAFKLKDLPEVVPLFYSLPHASERLGSKDSLYVLPGIALVFFFINSVCIFYFVERDIVLTRILALTNLLVAVLSLYTLVRIVYLIT